MARPTGASTRVYGKPKPHHQSGASTHVYGDPTTGANTNQGEGTAKDKGKKRFRWKNGSMHTRRQGAEFRNHGGSADSGTGGNHGTGGGGHGGGGHPAVHHDALTNEMNAAVNLKYGDESRGLIRQQNSVGGWFDQYRAALAKARSDSAALYNVQPGAPAGGTPIPEITDPNDVGQQAAANRAALSNSFAGLMHDQGANITSAYDAKGANSHLMEIGQREAIGRDLTALRKEKGAFRTDFKRQRREDNRQYNLEAAALGVNPGGDIIPGGKLDPDGNGRPGDQSKTNAERNALVTSGPFAGLTHKQVRNLDPDTKDSMRKAARGSGSHASANTITSGAFAGFSQNQLKTMKPGRKQQLIDKYNKLTHPGKKKFQGGKDRNGNTRVQRRGNNNAWEGALDGLRSDYPDKKYDGVTASDIATDYHVPHDVAEAALYWAQHGAHLSPAMKRRLKGLSVNFRDDGYKGQG